MQIATERKSFLARQGAILGSLPGRAEATTWSLQP